jgi:hypothetical protein
MVVLDEYPAHPLASGAGTPVGHTPVECNV